MGTNKNIGTRSLPLKFAQTLTKEVNAAWESGDMLQKVTSITAELLKYWFDESHCDTRDVNFHAGQKQAIINAIYVYEVLRTQTVMDMWEAVDELSLGAMGVSEIAKDKYSLRKYCVKMSTGTGKTWVMHALLIWQYLNATATQTGYDSPLEQTYTNNFLLIAPGLIVYERLLGAFLGKERASGERDFLLSDFYTYRELFIPAPFREQLFNFLRTSVVKKDDIMQKSLGNGVIVITNWHLFMNQGEEAEKYSDPADAVSIVKELLPLTPGVSAGNSLDTLDKRHLSGNELEALSKLPSLMVINDEAHHIHENKIYGESKEVEWQKTLNIISQNISDNYLQLDFSATPYNVTGGGDKRTKHYFPHIIVDFDLYTAIHSGLVKIITLDKRQELANIPLEELDFRATRDAGNAALALSEGQKIMLDAGVVKLKILEDNFLHITREDTKQKHPKLLVICEDTKVSPLVQEYLVLYKGFAENEVMKIDSSAKGEIPEKEWKEVKQRLFDIDNHSHPKVIISVLMLREGFDVNNICVIVPLRSSKSDILLEQIVGRGLRLMWRGGDFEEMKRENRENIFKKKVAPSNLMDILSIIEHPAYNEFYRDLIEKGEVFEDTSGDKSNPIGDLELIHLKPNYAEYDIYIPMILHDKEEVLREEGNWMYGLKPYNGIPFEALKKMTADQGNVFYSEEITVETRFGKYKVTDSIIDADCYNIFLAKVLALILSATDKGGRGKNLPKMQINNHRIMSVLDTFIRQRLFDRDFNPLYDENWRILILKGAGVIDHIIKEITRVCWEMQNEVSVIDAEVSKRYFSECSPLKIRSNYRIKVAKSIFEYLPFPSNKGEFERAFMEFIDNDSQVDRFIKVKEHIHNFCRIFYLRSDGMISAYFPDFVVKIGDEMYVVETKAQKDFSNEDVISKKKSATEWCRKVNELEESDRMHCTWFYSMVSDAVFYLYRKDGSLAHNLLRIGHQHTKEKRTGQMVIDDLIEE
ncbi:MAG: DEAD/DEAH box helicase family protein [Candidatus Cloacimonetes bacterium]|nr:DEAD/DEAH box helicase family protein [Candidatus Cloacimonadota bacterium]